MLTNLDKEFKAISIATNSEILIAVSGGVDSMVLWQLMDSTNKNYGIAHVNFCLRGKESDADEAMVKKQAEERGVPFHALKINTKEYAEKKGLSIQMAAREIRYEFFQQLIEEKGYDVLATGHHLQDNIETFFINLNRGTGLKGLSGINTDKKRFRPLLNFTKEEIRNYADENGIIYREDASNSEVKYERNWFRHEVLKPWQERNPNFYMQMKSNLERFKETNELFEELLKEKTQGIQKQLKKGKVEIELLNQFSLKETGLYFVFSPYGFNKSQLNNLRKSIETKNVGKQFSSSSHTLTIDRKELYLKKNDQIAFSKETEWEIEVGMELQDPLYLQTKETKRDDFKFSTSKLKEGFDCADLKFPLCLRRWREGDKMRPLGMKGVKKVSDILIDEKIPLSEKENTYVIVSDNQIVWLVGIKPDDRFKINKGTTQVLEIIIE